MLTRLKHHLQAMHRDDRGAMSVEKVLIIAVIALPILIALVAFRNKISGWFQDEATELENVRNGTTGG